jgi:hypothetical protein
MCPNTKHKWVFRARFRRGAFGWRSQPAIKRIKEAVSEIRKAARKDPVLGAEGAVLFLEKLSAAIENVDSSSGAIGTAVNNAIEALVPVIADAPANDELRDSWMERLWDAVEEDEIPYIELMPDYWGELCVAEERASRWADKFIDAVRMSWSLDPECRGYFEGTSACLSALLKASRYQELLELLELCPYGFWPYRQFGVRALVAMGRKADALRYAEDSSGINDNPIAIARACEEILLSSGMSGEAYSRYAIQANQKSTYLATFRAIAKKYPNKNKSEILRDLVASTPGYEGKWFAAAKSAGLFDEAVELANQTPCDPKTLTRAARDMKEANPEFALEAGMAALRWLVEGYGYEISSLDVWAAYYHTMAAAKNAGRESETYERICKLVAGETFGERFVTKVLGNELGLDPQG